jgi:tellurite resistance protein TerC
MASPGESQSSKTSFNDGLRLTASEVVSNINLYTLSLKEESSSWMVFGACFIGLIFFDNLVLNMVMQTHPMRSAALYAMFWVACAFVFCAGIAHWYSTRDAFMWMSGYMLEWMLSFDNLFVFHMIFSAYGTPNHLKQRALYLGIFGAVFFRLAFILVGEYFIHAIFWMGCFFGAFVVYTGVQTLCMGDDDDDDPSQHFIVQWLQRTIPFVSIYDAGGAFFIRVQKDKEGNVILPSAFEAHNAVQIHVPCYEDKQIDAKSNVSVVEGDADGRYGTFVPNKLVLPDGDSTELRATLLFLVVCCLEISDILFAVDSGSAIVAQVPDLFLAYSSTVFAMLGLRAMFFVIDDLVQTFSLLKYGVGTVLVFIGFKLILHNILDIPPGVVCFVLVSTLGASMLASIAQEATASPLKEAKEDTPRVITTA